MKNSRDLTTAVSVFAFLCVFSMLGGGTAQARWSYEVSLSVGAEYNDNVDLISDEVLDEYREEFARWEEELGEGDASGEPAEEVADVPREVLANLEDPGDWIFLFKPRIFLTWEEMEDSLSFTYDGTHRKYNTRDWKTDFYHWGEALLKWHRFTPFRLEVSDKYDYELPSLARPEEDESNLIARNEVTVRPSLYWEIDRSNVLEISLEGLSRNYVNSEVEMDDEISKMAELTFERRWGPTWETVLTGGYGRTERSLADDYDVASAGFEFSYRVSPLTDFEYGLTWENRMYDQSGEEGEPELSLEEDGPPDETPFWLHQFSLRRRLKGGGELAAVYEDHLENRYDGETLKTGEGRVEGTWALGRGSTAGGGLYFIDYSYLVEKLDGWEAGVFVKLEWRITAALTFNLYGKAASLAWEDSREDEEGEPEVFEEEATTYTGKGILRYEVTRFISLEAAYERVESVSDFPTLAYRNNRYLVGITASF